MLFNKVLLTWFKREGRKLPWRNIKNPYYIMVSEFILQQTRVAQGMGYYLRFIDKFPTIRRLASANIDEVMKVWQGLGYYTRARNLHNAAKQIVNIYGGKIPQTYSELLKIKGLGTYSAAAVASFAFGEVVPAVDGNVYRILSRVYGILTPIDSSQGKKEFFDLASELIDTKQPAKFNQAIIDFGALVCTYKQPKCPCCIFSSICYAFCNNIVDKLPVKGKRGAVRCRYFTYLMINHKGYTFIRRRENDDIWHLLYEFPMIETFSPIGLDSLMQTDDWRDLVGGSEVVIKSVSEPVKHQLSHITIYATFIIVDIIRIGYRLKSDYRRIRIEDVDKYSVPRLIDSYMAAESSIKYFRKTEKYS